MANGDLFKPQQRSQSPDSSLFDKIKANKHDNMAKGDLFKSQQQSQSPDSSLFDKIKANKHDNMAKGDLFKPQQQSQSPASSLLDKIKANRPENTALPKAQPKKATLSEAEKIKKARIDARPDLQRIARAHGDSMHQLVIGINPNNIDALEEKLLDVSDPKR
jgi:hypothetical protein